MSRMERGFVRWLAASLVVAGFGAATAARAGDSEGLPEIRTSAANRVPACVTPERLMAFVQARNLQMPAKFSAIASVYRELGEGAHVRWDYAFFQMVLETNYLMYRRGDGSSGDVGQAQNNFAGIGATGGGVAGDKYGDVRTGVLAHLQHLVAYSGEHVEKPVATRTREYQNDIIEISRKLGRRVTFGDLSRRWAVDRAYGRNIETVAQLFRRTHCTTSASVVPPPSGGVNPRTAFAPPNRLGVRPVDPALAVTQAAGPGLVSTVWRRGEAVVAPAPRPALRTVVPRARAEPQIATGDAPVAVDVPPLAVVPAVPAPAERLGVARFALAAEAGVAAGALAAPVRCQVYSASFGGSESVLIKSRSGNEVRLTAVTVVGDERRTMANTFIATHAPGGEIIGHFESKEAAVSAARGICRAS